MLLLEVGSLQEVLVGMFQSEVLCSLALRVRHDEWGWNLEYIWIGWLLKCTFLKQNSECVYVCNCAPVCSETGESQVFCSVCHFLPYFLTIGFLPDPGVGCFSGRLPAWPASSRVSLCVSVSQSSSYRCMQPFVAFTWVWAPTSGPHVYVASILGHRPSAQPSNLNFWWLTNRVHLQQNFFWSSHAHRTEIHGPRW